MAHRGKIFGIGLSKTGTTSLTEALRILGYTAIHYDVGLRHVAEFDAATDTPVADAFERLDRKYPGSKFILTARERSSWLKSCKRHWSRLPPYQGEKRALFERLYGTSEFDEQLFSAAYDRHDARVFAHFAERPSDLLVIDITKDPEPWERLCRFLDRPIPHQDFPHARQFLTPYTRGLKRALARTPTPLRRLIPGPARSFVRWLLRVPARSRG